MHRFSRYAALLAGMLFLSMGFEAAAQIPEQLQFRGFLTSSAGVPVDCPGPLVCSTPPNMVVRLYTDPVAQGAPLFTETHVDVFVDKGNFDLVIGAFTPLEPSNFEQPLFLGVDVNGDGEALPRISILSVPTALQAFNSQSVQGLTPDDLLTVDDVGLLTGPEGPPGPSGASGNVVHHVSSTEFNLGGDWVTTDIAVEIVPVNTSSKFLVLASVQAYTFGGNSNGIGLLRLARDGTPLPGTQVSLHTGFTGSNDLANTVKLMTLDIPVGPGPFLYSVQARSSTGIFQLNQVSGVDTNSNIVVQEL